MKSVHSSIRNVVTYAKNNKEDLIAKLNSFLLVTLVTTLLVAWNVRSDNTVSSNAIDIPVDELEQIVKVTTEIETSNVLLLPEMYCYTSHIAQCNDGDYKKVYPYFSYIKCLTMDNRYDSITSRESSFNNNTKKINVSDLVYSDIGTLPYTYNYIFKLVKNIRNNNYYFNFNKVGVASRIGREITPFTFARARAPGLITLANIDFKIIYLPMGSLDLGSSNSYSYVHNYS
jgi:hypothetical protein